MFGGGDGCGDGSIQTREEDIAGLCTPTQHFALVSQYVAILFFVIKPTRCTNFTNLFWHETLHVSDSSSVHHQEFAHCTLSNGVCHTGL